MLYWKGSFYGISGIAGSIDMGKLGPTKLAAWDQSLDKLSTLPLLSAVSAVAE